MKFEDMIFHLEADGETDKLSISIMPRKKSLSDIHTSLEIGSFNDPNWISQKGSSLTIMHATLVSDAVQTNPDNCVALWKSSTQAYSQSKPTKGTHRVTVLALFEIREGGLLS
jgi:hypothetical protein